MMDLSNIQTNLDPAEQVQRETTAGRRCVRSDLCCILRVLSTPSFLPSRLSSLIVFLISPNIIVIWPDDDGVYNQNFSEVKLLPLPITLSDWLPQNQEELASNRIGAMSFMISVLN